MTIRYQCEECGSVLNIKDEKAGTQGRCPKCKAEFLVPTPGTAPPETAEAAGEETAVVPPEKTKSPSRSAKSAGTLSDDDIEKILEGKEGAKKASSAPPRDDYGIADDDDDDYDEDDDDEYEEDDEYDDEEDDYEEDDEDNDEEDDAPPVGIPGRTTKRGSDEWNADEERLPGAKQERRRAPPPPPQPVIASAGIAQGLMGRGDRGARAEPKPERRSGRLFGAGGANEDDRDDDEGFPLTEKIAYIARYALPLIIGGGIGVLIFTWWLTGWQRGKLPTLAAVSGTVTLDGDPLPRAEVHFHPMQDDPKVLKQQSSSIGFTDNSGRYTLTYIEGVQGAVPGKHRVQVFASDEKGQQLVPTAYNARSNLYAQVPPEGSSSINFELKSTTKEGGSGKGSFNPPRGR